MRLQKPRIAPMTDAQATEEQLELVKNRRKPGGELYNVYRTMLTQPAAARGFLGWGRYVLSDANDLPGREREIVILRTGYLCRSGYEWGHHVVIARREGLTDVEIERIKAGPDAPGWSAADKALLQAADELHHDQFITDAVWAELSKHFTEKQRMDVAFTVGQYTQVCMFLNTFGVQLEDGWPLDPDLKG